MEKRESLLKNPIILLSIAAFTIIFIILLFISFSKSDEDTYSGSKTTVTASIENYEILNQALSNTQLGYLVDTVGIFFSNVFSNISSLKIDENSVTTNNGTLEFKTVSNKNDIFYFNITDSVILIKNSNKEEIFLYNTNISKDIILTPALLEDYFPYKNRLSNKDSFEATLSGDIIEISIPSCVSKEYENEAIQKTKEYLEKINSNPSFFDYQVSTFCF